MKRFAALFVFALIGALIYGVSVFAFVTNGDFEAGTFASWTQSTFINNGFSAATGAGGIDLSAIVGGPAVAALSQSDPNSNGAILYPAYGHYSARVNSDQSYSTPGHGQNGNKITQIIPAYIDPADSKAHIRFTYAAIMVDPAHTADQQPYFRVRAINTSNGNDILYDFSSYVGEPGKNWLTGAAFSGGGFWKYLDWSFIDLTPTAAHPVNAGDNVRVEVSAAGCALGGHPGYVYVDEISDHEIAGSTVSASGPATVQSGNTITYTYNYRNGSGGTINATVNATQPAGVTFTSVSNPVNCSVGATVTCNFSNLASLATGSFTITGTVTAAGGTQVAHGNYNIAAAGFPTIGGQTVLTNVSTTTATTAAVSASPNPSVFGQNVTFTANVTPNSGGGTPTGTVQFVVDGVNFGSPVTLSGGTATLSTTALSVSAGHTVSGVYSGDSSFQGSSGALAGNMVVNKANSTVGVSAAPNPAVYGQPVTVTANVGAAAPGSGTPGGTVTFFVDGVAVCSNVALSGGSATCSLGTLSTGNHTITVTYGGNGNFNGGSGSLGGGLNVNKANTTLGLSASPNPSVAGQAVTITASVAPVSPGTGTPSGTVTFSLDGNVVCTNVILSGAQATCNLPAMGAGSHTVTATYGGDSNFNGSNGNLAGGLTVNKANTTLALSALPNPSVSGQAVTITANVAPVAPGTGTPSGTVTFNLDGNVVCTNVALSGGLATCNLPAMGAGSHTVTATYGGDSNFNGSNGNLAGGLTVNKANTTTTLAASPNPSVSGQAVSVTATVAAVAPGSGTPGGTVTFNLDGNAVCTNVALSGAQATCNLPAMGAGSHTVTAIYGGNSNFNGSNGPLSGGLTVNKADATIVLAGAPTPSIFGQQVTFTATVSVTAPGAGMPTGNVSFRDNGVNIGTCAAQTVASNVATCQISTLSVGTHPITAVYNGDGNFNGSPASNTVNEVVNPLTDLSMTMSDGVTSAPAGSTVVYTIVVSNAGPSTSNGATVNDIFPAAVINAQWTCAGAGGGTCGASGTGNINQTVGLPAGGSVTYTVAAMINSSATGTLSNTATVIAPPSATDPNPANNSATDIDTLTAPSVFVIDDVLKNEGQSGTTSFTFTVSKLGGTGFATSVQYQTFDGTATVAGSDYQAASGTLSFGPLETAKTITVTVNGDTAIEPDETFFVRLLNPPVNALIGDPEGRGLIVNDDFAATPTPTPTPNPTPTPGPANRFEGDINRTAFGVPGIGDGDVTVGDQIQYQRFLGGTDCPSPSEQMRLDAGQRSTLGDGLIGSADGTAIDAYARHDAATDSDPNTPGWQPTPVGGPTAITNLGCTPPTDPEGEVITMAVPEPESASAARVVRVVSRSGSRNSDIMVDIEMTAQGNEAGTQFGFHFDPTVLAISDVSGVNVNPDISLGANAPAGTTLNVNAEDAANGNIGIGENFNGAAASITAIPEGATRIARVKFHVLDGAAAGSSRVTFDDSVIRGFTSDVNGMVLSASYDQSGSVSVTSSRGVTVSGRVTSSDGRGIRNATVTIVDGGGFARTVTTSSFGYYTFDDVAAATYTIAVSSRQYRYASRTVEVADNLADVNFTGLE